MKVISFLKEKTGYLVSPDAMFDVQVESLLLNSDLMFARTSEKKKGIYKHQNKIQEFSD